MIPYSRQLIDQNDINAVIDALKSDIITCGKKVDEFEKAICDYIGVKYAVVMNSATSALHVAYLCLGLKNKDEVITTPITFAATSNAALMCGGEVKFCDIKFDGNIDENKIENLITQKTKIITPVDFGGNPVEIDKIIGIAKKYNLKVLNDASHAFGSQINKIKVGTKADITVFSFHAIKPITTIEGGCLCTNDENIANLAKLYRSHGIIKKQAWNSQMSLLGYNYRLSDVACALGLSQIKKLDEMIKKRENIAKFYDEKFENSKFFSIIKIPQNKKSTRHLYPILLNRNLWCEKQYIYEELHKIGILVQVHYKPTYEFEFYKKKYKEIKLKNADEFYKSELSIPCHQKMSMDDAKFITSKLYEIISKIKKWNNMRDNIY